MPYGVPSCGWYSKSPLSRPALRSASTRSRGISRTSAARLFTGMISRSLTPIVGDAAPRHAADVAGNDERAFQRRRREESVGAQRADGVAAPGAVLVGRPPGVVGLQRRRRERARRRRERLRRRRDLARHVALRDRALLDGNERRSGLAIQDEEMPVLEATPTAATVRPSLRQSNRMGGDATS